MSDLTAYILDCITLGLFCSVWLFTSYHATNALIEWIRD